MGTWDTGIFGNDNAADFKGSVANASDVQARHDVLSATMGALLEKQYGPKDLAGDYSFGYETEMALAAAAYVADAKNSRHQFTDTSYAMGHNREIDDPMDDAAWYHIDIGTPGPDLVAKAVRTVEKVLAQMEKVDVLPEWQEAPRELLAALKE